MKAHRKRRKKAFQQLLQRKRARQAKRVMESVAEARTRRQLAAFRQSQEMMVRAGLPPTTTGALAPSDYNPLTDMLNPLNPLNPLSPISPLHDVVFSSPDPSPACDPSPSYDSSPSFDASPASCDVSTPDAGSSW